MNWIVKQTEYNISQFDKNMEKYYPESTQYVSAPQKFYERIVEQTNYLEAVKLIDWDKYLKPGATVLDLGGGIGWLTAYLSGYENVAKINFLDSSRDFVEKMMPEIVRIMAGNPDKIVPVEALFSPLYFEDKSLDVVVICSTLHHADNIEALLVEIKRILKDDGVLLVLNETPVSHSYYVVYLLKQFIKIMANTLSCTYKSDSPSISSSGSLCDPYLFDRMYPLWYWNKAINLAGFSSVKVVDSGYVTLKSEDKGLNLTHFICCK